MISTRKGNYFAEGRYLKYDIAEGTIHSRRGTRICALTTDFLIGLRKAIIDECGGAAEEVMISCGVRWGRAFARRFSRDLEDHFESRIDELTVATLESCAVEAFSHHGFGKLDIDWSRHDIGLILVSIGTPIYGDLLGQADQPVDSVLSGVLAGFFSELTGEDLGCIQTQCVACGDAESRFVIGLSGRLDLIPEGTSHDKVVEHLATSTT